MAWLKLCADVMLQWCDRVFLLVEATILLQVQQWKLSRIYSLSYRMKWIVH